MWYDASGIFFDKKARKPSLGIRTKKLLTAMKGKETANDVSHLSTSCFRLFSGVRAELWNILSTDLSEFLGKIWKA